MPHTTRRDVLALAAAPLFVPASAFGAGDKLTYGLIAAGGRGRYLNRIFQKQGHQVVALCDVYQPNLELAKKESPAGVKTFGDYNDLLAMPGLDAVVIASPDHHHYPMLKAALAAKKDVYLEKPVSHSLEESQKMIQLVRGSKQIVQVGMQRRSAPAIHQAKKLVDDGILGKVTVVKPQWHWNISQPLDNSPLPGELDWTRFLGSARKRPVEPQRFRKWRYFFDYAGGNMTDQGTHLMDVVQWFMKTGSPKSAVSQGYVAKMTGSEHTDVFSAIFEYDGFLVNWTLDYANSYQNGWSITFLGDKGTLIMDDAGFKIFAEPWKKNAAPIHEEVSPVPVEAHVDNFAECVRSRKDPNCTVEIAAAAVSGPHLANLAMFKGRKMLLNGEGRAAES
jgi:predicted dehydrogenase